MHDPPVGLTRRSNLLRRRYRDLRRTLDALRCAERRRRVRCCCRRRERGRGGGRRWMPAMQGKACHKEA